MIRPCLAAITLDPKGGGVAVVSRLLWRVFSDRWRDDTRLFTLIDDTSDDLESLDSSTATRVRFGTALAGGQALGQCQWVFYSHLSVARVQSFVPAPFRRPYGVFLHGIEAWQPLGAAQRKVLQGAALRISNSRFTADRVAEANHDIGPIAVCPLTVEPEALSGRSPIGVRPAIGEHAVLIVARMLSAERYKGHDALLEAWPIVKAHLPGARLVCVGDGDDAPRLRQKAHELGIDGEVLFTGFVSTEDLHGFYEDAAVFAMPSRGEGFGLVYLEAMAHGLACIGSVHDAAGEIIDDGVTGHLVNQSDPRELGAALLGLLSNHERRRQMGANGRRRFERDFSYGAFATRVVGLLEEALAVSAGSELPEATPR